MARWIVPRVPLLRSGRVVDVRGNAAWLRCHVSCVIDKAGGKGDVPAPGSRPPGR